MNRKQLGDLGVAKALAYYTDKGYAVSIPFGDNSKYDLIIDDGERLQRVQVKTSNTQVSIHGVPVVTLSTQGGNQSWGGSIRPILVTDCELVFVHVANGKSYEFPVEHVANKRSLNLGKLQEQWVIAGVGEPGQAVTL